MIKTKRSQTELIVTVLLVLIALAAVAFIASFIMNQVRKGGEIGDVKVTCLNLDFKIVSAVNGGTTVSVQRDVGGEDTEIDGVRVLVDGTAKNTTSGNWTTLETKSIYVGTLATGQKVEIAPILKGGVACSVKDTATVTTA